MNVHYDVERTKRVLDRIELKCGGPHSGIDIDRWITNSYLEDIQRR